MPCSLAPSSSHHAFSSPFHHRYPTRTPHPHPTRPPIHPTYTILLSPQARWWASPVASSWSSLCPNLLAPSASGAPASSGSSAARSGAFRRGAACRCIVPERTYCSNCRNVCLGCTSRPGCGFRTLLLEYLLPYDPICPNPATHVLHPPAHHSIHTSLAAASSSPLSSCFGCCPMLPSGQLSCSACSCGCQPSRCSSDAPHRALWCMLYAAAARCMPHPTHWSCPTPCHGLRPWPLALGPWPNPMTFWPASQAVQRVPLLTQHLQGPVAPLHLLLLAGKCPFLVTEWQAGRQVPRFWMQTGRQAGKCINNK